MADATTPTTATTATKPPLPASMTPDLSAMYKDEASQRKHVQAMEEEQFQQEQTEHAEWKDKMDAMSASVHQDMQDQHQLLNMNPDELDKYLNLAKFTQPPKKQSVVTAMGVKAFVPLLIGFALLGGKLGSKRFQLIDSLTALGGVMKGLQEGNDQAYQKSYQDWKDSTDLIAQDNATRIQAYKDTLQNRSMDIDQRLQLLQILSTQDPYTHALAKGGDIAKITDHVTALDHAYQKFVDHYVTTDGKLKPIKVDKDVLSSTGSILYGDENIPKPDSQDPTKNPWWYALKQKEANYAQFLLNQSVSDGEPITPYEASLEAHQYAYQAGWIKAGMTGFREPQLPKVAAPAPTE